jgi:hypothetical protein
MVAKIFIDPKFHFHPKYKEIYSKISTALKKFPEITYVVLSSFYPTKGEDVNSAVNVIGCKINFNIKIMPTYNTIYHELWHVVQDSTKKNSKPLTKFEQEATLMGLSRMSKAHIETNLLPYVGTVPSSKIAYYTNYAVTLREKKDPLYIEKTIKLIEQHRKNAVAKNKNKSTTWTPNGHDDIKLKLMLQKEGKNIYVKGYTPEDTLKLLNRQVKELPASIFQATNDKIWVYSKNDLKSNNWMKATSKKSNVNKNQIKKVSKNVKPLTKNPK